MVALNWSLIIFEPIAWIIEFEGIIMFNPRLFQFLFQSRLHDLTWIRGFIHSSSINIEDNTVERRFLFFSNNYFPAPHTIMTLQVWGSIIYIPYPYRGLNRCIKRWSRNRWWFRSALQGLKGIPLSLRALDCTPHVLVMCVLCNLYQIILGLNVLNHAYHLLLQFNTSLEKHFAIPGSLNESLWIF